MFFAVCNEGVKAEKVEKEILLELEKIKTQGILHEEIEKLKINTKAQFVYSLESSSSVADMFSSYLARGNIEPLMNYENEINKLSQEKLKEIANKYFIKENSITMILRKEDNK